MRALLFDMDGVLYNSDTPIEGAAETVAWVRTRQIPHLFLTNTTSKSRAALVAKLAALGIPAEECDILTPPVAAAHWLRANHFARVALFVQAAASTEFSGLALVAEDAETGADAVVIGDLAEAWDFAALNRAFRLLQSNPKAHLIALGGTKFWQGPTGLQLDVAPFTAALECATGRKAAVFGKPSRAFYQAALDRLGVPAEDALIVGDDIEVDIAGAQVAGLKAALVQTGKFRTEQLSGNTKPDYLWASVAGLKDILS
jgi:HAD superfamily hydrolase (TIGR01458 family)